MNDAPRQTLRALVARHGTGLCSDARRCEALLRDHAGAHRREINILVSALKERVPLDLLAGQSAMPRAMLAARLTKRLEDHLALTPEAARWAVDSWALALGVATEEEVAGRERRTREEERERERKSAPPSQTTAGEQRPAPFGAEAERDEGRAPTQPTQQPARPSQPQRQQQQSAPPASRATAPAPKPQAPPVFVKQSGRQPPPTHVPSGGTLPSPAQAQARDARPRRRRSLRGCAVGCLLLVLLALGVFVGGPFVVSLLREDQEQRAPSPVLSP